MLLKQSVSGLTRGERARLTQNKLASRKRLIKFGELGTEYVGDLGGDGRRESIVSRHLCHAAAYSALQRKKQKQNS